MGWMRMVPVLAVGLLSVAVGNDFVSLVENSPFGVDENMVAVDNRKKEQEKLEATGLELRGVFIGPEVSLFNVYTDGDKKCRWVRRGESFAGITVDSFDADSQTLYFHTAHNVNRSVRLKHTIGSLRQLGVTLYTEDK
jgi:hypothetical protein